jgi:hypothetical protein
MIRLKQDQKIEDMYTTETINEIWSQVNPDVRAVIRDELEWTIRYCVSNVWHMVARDGKGEINKMIRANGLNHDWVARWQ